MILGVYFARQFFISFLRVSLIVATLLFLANLLNNITKISDQPNAIFYAISLAGLNIPTSISQTLSIIIMLASISFSVSMARSNEFIVSRSIGIASLKLLSITGLLVISIGIFSIIIFDPFANSLLEKRNSIKSNTKNQMIAINENGVWLRQKTDEGHMLVQANSISNNGKILREVTIVTFDKEGIARNREYAYLAFLNDGILILNSNKHWDLTSSNPEKNAHISTHKRYKTTFTPEQILEGFPKPESLSIWKLFNFSRQIEAAGFSPLKYKMQLQISLARPILFLAMFLIGIVFTLKNSRMGNLGLAMFYSLSLGFSLYFLQNFAKTLGEAGQIPTVVAAWAPPLAASLLMLTLFLHLEDG